MTQDEIIELARKSGALDFYEINLGIDGDEDALIAFAKLVAAKERDAIKDEFWLCLQSDLENGVKSLNEKASEDFARKMPELSKFGDWLEARGMK
jgi:hypothetical protein